MDYTTYLATALLAFAATRAWLLRSPQPSRPKTMAEIRAEWLTQRHHWQGGK
jgi:hypothetical protein